MTYFMGEGKPSLSALAHHGVKGMKWGKRKATTAEIISARKDVRKSAEKVADQKKVVRKATTQSGRSTAEKKLSELNIAYLKNPNRVIAARMTRGEQYVSIIAGAVAIPVVGGIIGGAAVATSSARSRQIEKQQAEGKFDKK